MFKNVYLAVNMLFLLKKKKVYIKYSNSPRINCILQTVSKDTSRTFSWMIFFCAAH